MSFTCSSMVASDPAKKLCVDNSLNQIEDGTNQESLKYIKEFI